MPDLPSSVEQYLSTNANTYVEDLKELLRIPSISADSKYRGDVRQAGEWVRDKLVQAGLQVELVETAGHPIVYAEWLKKPGAPTVMSMDITTFSRPIR